MLSQKLVVFCLFVQSKGRKEILFVSSFMYVIYTSVENHSISTYSLREKKTQREVFRYKYTTIAK